MSDADEAQKIEIREWERHNASRSVKVKFAPDEAGYGPEFCVECDDDMIHVRRGYGFTNCVECQTKRERQLSQRY